VTGIIFATCASGDGSTYREIALPSIERIAADDDRIVSLPGDARGICAVYNDFIHMARRSSCSALVLIQDDVEIHDPEFRTRILAAAQREGAGVIGAIGGRDVPSMRWWKGEGVGGVFETRGPIFFPQRSGRVDAVDGVLIALSRRAILGLEFDAATFPRFHGYDADISFAARSAGLDVEVVPLRILHRTKARIKHKDEFVAASEAFHRKYAASFPGLIAPNTLQRASQQTSEPARAARLSALRRMIGASRARARRLREAARSLAAAAVAHVRGLARRSKQRALRVPPRQNVVVRSEAGCLACGDRPLVGEVPDAAPSFLDCPVCRSSVTWPAPVIDATSERIWTNQYEGDHLARQDQWIREANVRLDWLETVVPGLRGSERRLLDVGAATGEFVHVARGRGYAADGVEPSVWAVAAAQRLGAGVVQGFVGTWHETMERRPDVVTLWHVLEHAVDPSSLLSEIRELLPPGGTLLLEVPNRSSAEAQRLGRRWRAAQFEEHVTHFSEEGLRRILERNGLDVRSVEAVTEEPYATEETWLLRTNRALLGRHDWPSYDLLRAVAVAP